ncbi:acetamidase/formamidase [Histoplasma ohiense]|nr:acetamidase/formamidase [Histoplasma ohiense (nom. inval.)]
MTHAILSKSIHIHRHQQHVKWSKQISPTQTINSGDIVHFDAMDGSNGQITKTSTESALITFDIALADPAVGPVFVTGAEPGDVLEVEILDLKTTDWGWTAIFPNFGLLSDEFPNGVLKIWHLDPDQPYALFKEGIQIPRRPFLGIMGVAPGADGEFSMIPPLNTGGNIDCRYLTVGSKLYLPVQTPGALFSCGDGHIAQGDGEVCGTAIETPLKASLRLSILKNQPWITAPQFQTPPRTGGRHDADETLQVDKGEYATMGIDTDLLEAARKATRNLIEWLVRTKGLTPEEAYMLASVAGNLKIVEIVDMPNYAVAMSLPLNIFV